MKIFPQTSEFALIKDVVYMNVHWNFFRNFLYGEFGSEVRPWLYMQKVCGSIPGQGNYLFISYLHLLSISVNRWQIRTENRWQQSQNLRKTQKKINKSAAKIHEIVLNVCSKVVLLVKTSYKVISASIKFPPTTNFHIWGAARCERQWIMLKLRTFFFHPKQIPR